MKCSSRQDLGHNHITKNDCTQVGAEGLKGAARAFYNPSSTRLGAKLFGGGESSVEKSRPQSLNLLDDYIRKAKK